VITLHPIPEVMRRGWLNRTQVRNFKATCKKGQTGPRTRDRDECCECAPRPGAESY
jgi:hypothetical protein